jgi:hypothetical protein
MIPSHKRLAMLYALLAGLGLGCGDDGNGENGAAGSGTGGGAVSGTGSDTGGGGTSGSSGMSASGQGGGAGLTGGAGGSAGSREQTPPPEMPRDLGPADGIYCQSLVGGPPSQMCPAGSRCCPSRDRDADPCVLDGGQCPACDAVTCGQLLCDGPEDCSTGQFCCYANRGSCSNNDDCTGRENSYWMVVDCRARCVSDQRDPDHGMVACKDDRDCPGPYVVGRCRELRTGQLPFGIKVCYSSGS